MLDNLYGGRIGGSDAVINVGVTFRFASCSPTQTSGLLELIVTDDKIKAGREILFKTKTVWK